MKIKFWSSTVPSHSDGDKTGRLRAGPYSGSLIGWSIGARSI